MYQRKPKVLSLIGCMAVCCLLMQKATAQTVSGVISGTVVDSSRLAVAAAALTLIDEGRGATRAGSSDELGNFVFTAVLPGRYTVAAEAKGFKRYEKRNLVVTAAERLSAGELVLEVGAVSESVTVTAEGTPVQTTSQERSAVLTNKQMEMLMSRSRDFVSMLRVLPGVIPQADDQDTMTRSLAPVIQGVRNGFNSMNIDGIMGNDLGSSEWMGSPISVDAISEIKVLMNNYQAEYGRNAGSVVNVITKNGTRDFHGTGYIYKRHEELNANSFFNNRNNVAKPRYRFATGGYNVGGPLYIPGKFNRNKDKLFFFFGHEMLRTEAPQSLKQITMPTILERAGDFSQTLDVSGKLVPIIDPLTGSPFAGNVIPSSRINSNGQKMLGVFPLPNILDRTITSGNYNYNFQESIYSPKQEFIGRLDYNATNKIRMYFRAISWHEDDQGYGYAAGNGNWPELAGHYNYTDKSGVYNFTYLISPTIVNEFSGAVHHSTEMGPARSAADVAKVDRVNLGITIPQFYPQNNPYNMIPWASYGGVPSAASVTIDGRWPLRGADTVFSFTDGLSIIRGAHTFKVGFFAERDRDYEGERGTFPGSFAFAKDVNNPLDSNYAYSNAILGNFDAYSESDTRPGTQNRGANFEWYAQDNWKVTKRLTLDYGIRFSRYIPYWQADGKAATWVPSRFDPKAVPTLYQPTRDASGNRMALNPLTGAMGPAVLIGGIVPNSGSAANGMVTTFGSSDYPKTFMDSQGVLFGPRVGFAYDPFGDGKTAIRGGFGMFFNTLNRGGITWSLVTNPPVQFTPVIYYGNLSSFINSSSTVFPSSVYALARGGETPSVYNYSFGIQRDIGFRTVLDVAYVGSLGRHLFQQRDLNMLPYGKRFLPQSQDPTTGKPLADNFLRPYYGLGSITYMESASNSSYHSLQVQANRRFSHGLLFGVSWTWSKAMDYTDGDPGTVATYVPVRVWNYGDAGFDRTHVLMVNWTWDLPKATRLWNNVMVKHVFDSWQLSGIASFLSGPPTAVGYSTVDGTDITGGGDGSRVVVTGTPTLSKSDQTFSRFFNTSAFQRPAQGTIGNASKYSFRGPGINNFDISIFKNFPVKEHANFQFRWEMYNAFNHAQFSSVDSTARFDLTGAQVNSRFGAFTAVRAPRVMQGSLRFSF